MRLRVWHVCLLLAVSLLPSVQAATEPTCLAGGARRDCGYGDQNSCESNGCCWTPVHSSLTAALTSSELSFPPRTLTEATIPWCYHKQSIVNGYKVVDQKFTEGSSTSSPVWKIKLQLEDGNGYFGEDIKQLDFEATYETKARIRVRVVPSDPNAKRWEIPESILPLAEAEKGLRSDDAHYAFSFETNPFSFSVKRKSDGEVLFNTASIKGSDGRPMFNGLIYSDQYLEISSQLPNQPVMYGLGEQVTSLQLKTKAKPITFWAMDTPTPVEENLYGAHPYYMENRRTVSPGKQSPTTKSHGVWLRNSNGMDVLLYDADTALQTHALNFPHENLPQSLKELEALQAESNHAGEVNSENLGRITYRVIGGVLDFHIYVEDEVHSTPEGITKRYHESIGRPHMPPFWSLGFQQCRWGYDNVQMLADVVRGYDEAKIPLDVAWSDIDWMQEKEDFIFDPVRFPVSAISSFVDYLHKKGQKYVLILDPAIHNRTGYPTFEKGLQQDLFIKRSNGELFIGEVWPGFTAFPSFLNNKTHKWWNDEIKALRDQVPIDGLWIDMNEAANFCNGHCGAEGGVNYKLPAHLQKKQQAQLEEPGARRAVATMSAHRSGPLFTSPSVVDPPYRIHNAGRGAPLNVKTIDMDATHGPEKLREYDVHNLYGFTETISSRKAMEDQMGTRSIVISRSTFPGSGHHAGHWLGDNWSTFQSMAESIAGSVTMNMFGVPYVGADICGFGNDSWEELCARWMSLGAFYTFARNHNGLGHASQEPYIWPVVAEASRKALAAKYSLLHVYNTLFFQAHKNGGTVLRPLFFEFAQDETTFPIGEQMMIGNAVLITPVLKEGEKSVWGYFPQKDDNGKKQLWYDFYSYEPFAPLENGWSERPAPLDFIPLHIRGGVILPLQQPALNTVAQQFNPFRLVVAIDSERHAEGSLFVDDGYQLEVGPQSLQTSFTFDDWRLTYRVIQDKYAEAARMYFDEISFLGMYYQPKEVSINKQAVSFDYDSNNKVIKVKGIKMQINKEFQVDITM